MSRQTALRASLVALVLAAGALFVIPAFAASSTDAVDGPVTCSTVDPYGKFDCQLPGYPTPAPSGTVNPSPTQTPTSEPTATPTVTTVTPTLNPTPTATPTPTPTVTPTPTPTTPPPAGWDAVKANAGVPAGTTLRQTSGRVVSVAGTVINGEHIRGCLTIRAANVVVRNSRIDCAGGHGIDSKASNVTLINLDISCGNTPYKGVVGWGFTLVASDIRGCEDGVYIDRDALVKDSYIHDLYEQVTGNASDPYGHTDGIQVVNEADRVWLQGNFVDNDTDHATSGYIGDGPNMDDIVIVGNYFTGAGYTVRCSQSGVRNVVQDNTIERGYHGWWTYCTRSGIVRSGNTLI